MTSSGAISQNESASLSDDVSFLLARTNALSIAAGNAALAPLGLKVRSYSVLAASVDGNGRTQREIASYLRLDPSQVVAFVDELQQRGWVERRPDPADRRVKVVYATAAGRAVHAAATDAAHRVQQHLYRALSDSQREQLTQLLRSIAFAD